MTLVAFSDGAANCVQTKVRNVIVKPSDWLYLEEWSVKQLSERFITSDERIVSSIYIHWGFDIPPAKKI